MKHLLTSLLLLSFCSSIFAQNNWVYSPVNGHRYMSTPTTMSWADASILADSMGPDVQLVTIRDAAENQWVYDNFDGAISIYWIGYTDQTVEGTWVWSSGELSSYTNWSSGQPDNWGVGGGQDCAIAGGWNWGLNWDDVEDGAEDCIAILETAAPLTFYVDKSGNGDYTDIQSAIDGSINGDTILVESGNYIEKLDLYSKEITIKSISGPLLTVLGNDPLFENVVSITGGQSRLTSIEGFTIKGARGGSVQDGGGLEILNNSSPTIKNCIFQDNIAKNGGAIHCGGMSNPLIIDCAIYNNSSSVNGGAIHVNGDSYPEIESCNIYDNGSDGGLVVTEAGGAIMIYQSSISIKDSSIYNNSAINTGGGMSSRESNSTTLESCTFASNEASEGGGMYGYTSSPTLTNCTFTDNTAGYGGGGICWTINSNSNPILENCTFTNNTAGSLGGGIYLWMTSPTFENCTFTDNTAGSGGGIQVSNDSDPTLTNCILWGNSTEIAGHGSSSSSNPIVTYSDVQGSWTGAGNIDADPLFVDPANGDVRLQVGSPCIDAGDPNSPLDPDGTRADMGVISFLDSDGDRLPDEAELIYGTDPLDQDTDDDGLSDGEEVLTFSTDPLNVDTDSDGLQDGTEVGNDTWWPGDPSNGIGGTDTSINIPDADPSTTTDPLDDDTDNDGLMDGQEDVNHDGQFLGIELDPNDFDCDNDGLGDGLELGLAVPNGNDTDMTFFVADADPSTTTRATLRDTDGGGISDGIEDANRNGMMDAGEINPRDASDDSVYMRISPMVEGGSVTFNYYGCEPYSWMHLCYSLAGPGPTSFTNITLDLSPPIGSRPPLQINSNGTAQLGPVPIPPNIIVGDQLWFQGVQISLFGNSSMATTTNMIPVTVQ
jgi:parallel beta-helix repeat protein/predicted outer membrane repeat protein